MSTWSQDELRKIAETDDLHISPFRGDGKTYGTPTWIWSVAVDGALYVRAYNGRDSRWYQAAMRQRAGRITAAGLTKEVTFEPVDGPINDRIDDAYRAKYHGSPYLDPMIAAGPRSATVKVVPRTLDTGGGLTMKVGILGSGEVGRSLADGFLALGHEVMLGSRQSGNPAASRWAQQAGANARAGSFEQAAGFGELVVLATLGTATPHAIEMAGPPHFDGKLVWDVTNPLDFSQGMSPKLVGALGSSAGETHQRLLPRARVVKVFNTVGHALFFRPKLQAGLRGDMFLCGDDADAKRRTADLVREFGWEPVDVGGIDASHYLEATCMVWVCNAMRNNDWNRAFKLVPCETKRQENPNAKA